MGLTLSSNPCCIRIQNTICEHVTKDRLSILLKLVGTRCIMHPSSSPPHPVLPIAHSGSLTRWSPPLPLLYTALDKNDFLLLLLPPCFYIAKCNKRECCCIWLSGPGLQNLDIWLSGPGFQDLDKQTLGTSHRHSQSGPLPCLARTGPARTLPWPVRDAAVD
jgi:hypothetical protein